MSYESPAYGEMKRRQMRIEAVRTYVDRARTFRSMLLGGVLTVSTIPGRFGSGADSVALTDSLQAACLNFLAQHCEDIAARMEAGELDHVDIAEACKV